MKKILLSFLCGVLSIGAVNAQLDIAAFATPYTTDFTGYDGSGFAPTPAAGQLDSDTWSITGLSDGTLAFGATGTAGDYARGASAGGVGGGGFYSFDNGTGASLGVQSTGGDFTPGTLIMKMTNNTGGVISDLDIAYNISVNNDQARGNTWNFSHSADDVTYTDEASLDFTSPEAADAVPMWVNTARSISLTGVNIAAGADYFIRWSSSDALGGGSRDEIALDDLVVTAQGTSGPFISATPSSLSGFTQFVGTPSNEQSFNASASNLTADILVTAPTDYEVSLTSGAGFGATVTIPFGTGTVASTPVYVRLNGTVANPSVTGNVVLTSALATDINVALSGQILTPTPFINLTPDSLGGFYNLVPTVSAEQTFTAEAANLTADLLLTAPTDYEISTTSGSGFGATVTLPFGSGTIAATTIYTRLNGTVANPTANGFVVGTSAGATNDTVEVTGTIEAYVLSTIAAITTEDASGVANSVGDLVEIRGVVHCVDFDDNAGYKVTVLDIFGDGIQMFSFNDFGTYTNPLEGDSLVIWGSVGQFNGLTQINPDSILLASQGGVIHAPITVTTLDEVSESQVVTMNGLTLVTPVATWSTGNVDVSDGTNTFTMRIEAATAIAGNPAPSGSFSVTGVGGQYDTSNPYDGGYQLFPCSLSSIVEDCVNDTTELTELACSSYLFDGTGLTSSGFYTATYTNAGGCDSIVELTLTIPVIDVTVDNQDPTLYANLAFADSYEWFDCATGVSVPGATGVDFTPTSNGDYAVYITVQGCTDTSACETVATVSLNENLWDEVNAFPNPFLNELTITATSQMSYEVVDINGRVIIASTKINSIETISTQDWTNGVYFVRFKTETENAVIRVVK